MRQALAIIALTALIGSGHAGPIGDSWVADLEAALQVQANQGEEAVRISDANGGPLLRALDQARADAASLELLHDQKGRKTAGRISSLLEPLIYFYTPRVGEHAWKFGPEFIRLNEVSFSLFEFAKLAQMIDWLHEFDQEQSVRERAMALCLRPDSMSSFFTRHLASNIERSAFAAADLEEAKASLARMQKRIDHYPSNVREVCLKEKLVGGESGG